MVELDPHFEPPTPDQIDEAIGKAQLELDEAKRIRFNSDGSLVEPLRVGKLEGIVAALMWVRGEQESLDLGPGLPKAPFREAPIDPSLGRIRRSVRSGNGHAAGVNAISGQGQRGAGVLAVSTEGSRRGSR